MNANYFTNLMEAHQLKDETDKKEYTPTKKVLQSLTEVNPALYTFIQSVNPLNPDSDALIYRTMNVSKEERLIRQFFPLTSTQVYRLTEDGEKDVLQAWRVGLEQTIQAYLEELLCGLTALNKEKVATILTEAFMNMMTQYLQKKKAFLFDQLLWTLGTNMVMHTNQISATYQEFLVEEWYRCVQKEKHNDELVQLYRLSLIPFIDQELQRVLTSTDSRWVLSQLTRIDSYLQYVRFSKEEVIAEGKRIFGAYLTELGQLEKEKNQLFALCIEPNDPKIRKSYERKRREHSLLRISLVKAIEAFAKLEESTTQTTVPN